MKQKYFFSVIIMMTAMLLSAVPMRAQSQVTSCPVTLTMYDSYGDGWNDAALEVYQYDSLIGSFTFNAGRESVQTLTLAAAEVRLVWRRGQYDSECTFTFTDVDGSELFAFDVGTLPYGEMGDTLGLGSFVSSCPSCYRPTGLRLANVTPSSMGVTWTPREGTQWQALCVPHGMSSATMNPVTLSANTFTAEGLQPNTAYDFYVRALCGDDGASRYATCSGVTADTAAGCSYTVTLTDQNNSAFSGWVVLVCHESGVALDTLRFPNSALDYSRYEQTIRHSAQKLYLKVVPDNTNIWYGALGMTVVDANGDTVLMYNFDNLNLNDEYFDSIDYFCPSCLAPAVTAQALDSTNVRLSWNSTGADRYLIEYGTFSNDTASSTRLSTTDTFLVISNLVSGTRYAAFVAGVCDGTDTSAFRRVEFAPAQGILQRIYVNMGKNDTTDGRSWSTAYHTVGAAQRCAYEQGLLYGNYPDIWVAEGYYSESLQVYPSQHIYGGFAGDETDLSQRQWQQNHTVIDGGWNGFCLTQAEPFTAATQTVFDGLHFGNGRTMNGSAPVSLKAHTVLRNCGIENCSSNDQTGHGLLSIVGDPDHVITAVENCILQDGRSFGSVIYVENARIDNSLIIHNTTATAVAELGEGGALRHCDVVANMLFDYGNTHVVSLASGAALTNSIVAQNTLQDNTSGMVHYMTANLVNTFDGVSYSALNGAVSGTGNIGVDTLNAGSDPQQHYLNFIDPGNGDYRLNPGSAAIDAAIPLTGLSSTDLTSGVRVYGTAPDMGCYENTGYFVCLAPTGFAARVVEPASVQLSWSGAIVDGYEVSYCPVDGQLWTSVSIPSASGYTLTGLEEYKNYMVRVRAICSGTPTDYSDTLYFNSGCRNPIASLVVGSRDGYNSTRSDLPINMRYPYSGSYILLRASELGGEPRTIDTLGFRYTSGSTMTRHLRLGLAATRLDELTDATVPSVDSLPVQEVFDGEYTFSSYDWCRIPLQQPFEYDGASNLVLYMQDSTSSQSSYYRYFSASETGTGTVCNYYGYSPANFYGPYYTTVRPDIYINGGCDLNSCPRPSMSVVATGGDTVSLALSRLHGTPQLAISGDDGATYTLLAGVDSSTTLYHVTGLRNSATYRLRLRNICGQDDSSQWVHLIVTTAPVRYSHVYVKADANGTADGRTWNDAFADLTPALGAARATYLAYGYYPDIRVARGTYYGDTTAANAYYIQDPVNIYGGFAGNEPDTFDLSRRDFGQNVTVLDARHQRRVVRLAPYDNGWSETVPVFDGFTLRGGSSNEGAGLHVDYQVQVNNCRIVDCYGGNTYYSSGAGMYFVSSGSTVSNTVVDSCTARIGAAVYSNGNRFVNCDFVNCGHQSQWNNNNPAYNGIVYAYGDTLVGCRIMHDTATSSILTNGPAALDNCLIYDNHTDYDVIVSGGSYTLVNCDVVMNTIRQNVSPVAVNGGSLTNCLVWGNRSYNGGNLQLAASTVSYSAVQGGYEGVGNIALSSANAGADGAYSYPAFVSPETGDFRLMGESACVDAGLDSASRCAADLSGADRIYGQQVDMGCYEYHGETFCVPPYSLTVRAAATAAHVHWAASQDAASVQLEYRASTDNEWTVLDNITTGSIMLQNLQPQSAYLLRMRSRCVDGTLSGYSATCQFITECAGGRSVVAVGDTSAHASTSSSTPNYTRYSYYSFSQQLFMKNEIGTAGIIDTLRFQLASGLDATRHLKIYMGTTDRTSYSAGNDVILLDGQQLVYDTLVNFVGADGWLTIPLQRGYDYDGLGNLVLSVVDSSPSYYYYNAPSYYVESSNYTRTLYTNSYNPFSIDNNTYFSTTASRNVMLFSILCGNDGCARPLLSVSDVTDSSAIVTCQMAEGVELQYKADDGFDYLPLPLQEQQPLVGLHQNTRYTVRARAVCGEGDTSLWRTVSFTTAPRRQSRYYVSAQGVGNGTSWADAAGSLPWTLDAAEASHALYRQPVEVWVAQGVYSGGFVVREGVNVYGGFVGNEPETFNLAQRDFVQNATILDGGGTQRVLTQPERDFDTPTLWDGFTLRQGNVLNSGNTNGGGVYMRRGLRINHFTIEDCQAQTGGGIYTANGAVVENTIVRRCTSDYEGGGIYAQYSRLTAIEASDCRVRYSNSGSGIYAEGDTVIGGRFVRDSGHMAPVVARYSWFESCLVADNIATTGAAVSIYRSTLMGCDVVRNTVTGSGTVAGLSQQNSYNSNNTVLGTIVWGNRLLSNPTAPQSDVDSMRYSAVQGGYVGTGNLDLASDNDGSDPSLLYPLFASPDDGDYRLLPESPCVDAGSDAIATLWDTDVAGNPRRYGDQIDIGCFENDGTQLCVYPSNLSAQASSDAAVVSWTRPRGAIAVRLQYRADSNNEWTLIDQLEGTSYMLEGLSPQSLYHYRMQALCDGTSPSTWSATKTFVTECADGASLVVVGDSAARSGGLSYLPLNNYYNYSFSQQLFLAEELGDGGVIDTIRFQQQTGRDDNRKVRISMGHTSQDAFASSANVILEPQMTVVFDGTLNLSMQPDGWLTVPLHAPFDYNGTDNLVLTVVDSTGTYTSSIQFYTAPVQGNRTLYTYTDASKIQITSNGSYSTSDQRNVVSFNKYCGNIGCPRPLLMVKDVTDSSAYLVCQTPVDQTVELQYRAAGDAEYIPLPVVQSQVLGHLRQNTVYEVRTRALCSSGDSSSWRTSVFTTLPKRQNRYYVTAQGTGDGSSWTMASSDLNWVLATAETNYNMYRDPVEVWVAKGTYNGGFTIREGVNVYGGFAGNEPDDYDLSQRDFEANASVLDGQNVATVLNQYAEFSRSTALWDGFTVRGGKSTGNGGGVMMRGGTTINNFKVTNCIAQNGGGIYAYGENIQATITNTIVACDSATSYGGGIYAVRTRMENVLVHNNSARSAGGGMYIEYNCRMTQMTVVNNYVQTTNKNEAGAHLNSTYNNYIYNSIFWGNRNAGGPDQVDVGVVRASAIEGMTGTSSNGNYTLSSMNEGAYGPRFAMPTEGAGRSYSGGDWRLQEGSICINRGENGYAESTTDLDGNARVQQARVDMGCYESSYDGIGLPQYGNVVYVKPQAAGTADGTSWSNAMDDINLAQQVAANRGIANVWVAEGIYYGSPDVKNGAFLVVPAVSVYGGFVGDEPEDYDLAQRDIEGHPSILDGGNTRRVLYQENNISNSSQYVEWNGFTLRNGNVVGNSSSTYGGGAYLRYGSRLVGCTITANRAQNGGGVYLSGSYTTQTVAGRQYRNFSTRLVSCKISNNNATNNGGGVYINASSLVGNCLVVGNTAQSYGGGVYNSSGYVVGTTIVSNTSQNYSSGGYYCNNSSGRLDNSIVWGNKKGYYVGNMGGNSKYGLNAIEGGIADSLKIINLESSNDGTDMSKFYVRFVDPQHGDYTLHITSSALNYGDSLQLYYLPATDLAGNPRVMGGALDLGAYESDAGTSCPSVVGLAASNVTSSSATLSWMPMGEETRWSLKLQQEESGLDSVFDATDTVVVLDGLQLNRTYTVYVRAMCDSGGVSLYSIPLTFTTQCDETLLTPLDEFSSMLPENNYVAYSNKLDFAWTSMPMATSYDFYFWRSDESEPTTPTRRGLTTAGLNGFSIPNYTQNHGQTFNWKVVAWNECISRTSDVMTLQEASLPDLHVSGFTLPERMAAGQTVTIEWTVVNDGAGSTPPGAAWSDYIWLTGHNGVGGGFLYEVDEQLLATVPNLRALGPGESYTNSVEVQLPQDYVGGYYIFVFADQYSANNIDYSPTGDTVMVLPYTPSATGSPYPYLRSQGTSYPGNFIYSQMAETVETDNFFYIQKTILPPPTPNLHVTAVTHPLNAYSGESIAIQWQVTNEGDAAAMTGWTDAVYITPDTVLDYSTAILMGTYRHDGTLAVGGSYTGSVDGVLPLQLGGVYHVFVVTDIQDAVYENIYEADNEVASDQTMNIIMSPPADLQVVAVALDSTAPSTLSAGATYEVAYRVQNVGARAVESTHWRDVAYLTEQSTFDRASARRVGSRYNYNRNLGINEEYTEKMNITLPDSINGTRYLFVVADVDDEVFEYTYEDNNVGGAEEPLQIALPDLQVVWMNAPQTVVANQPVSLVWRVINAGQGDVFNRRVRNGLVFSNQTLVSHDVALNLAAGEYVEYTDSLMLPCSASDELTLYAKADMNNVMYETDENNSAGLTVSVLSPDLTVSNISVPDTLWSGTTATVSWTLSNSGQAAVDAVVTDCFYLGNAIGYNAADSIGRFVRQVTLQPGESVVESFEVSLPNGVQGQFYVHQVVNADASVCEGLNAASNHAVSAQCDVMLSPYPDLTVTDLEIPTALNIGEVFTLDYSVSNQGTGDLAGRTVTTQFYISHYNVFSKSTSTLMGDDSRPMTVAVGGQASYSTSLRVPTTITAGNYYIYAVVDATDVVYEYTYENNNTTRSSQLQVNVYPLDMAVTAIGGADVLDWNGSYIANVTVSNLSQVPSLANYWYTRVFLSQDDVLQSTDLQLGNVVRREVLEGDSSYTVNVAFKMPYGYTSPAYLIALADPDGNNPDVNTSNNILIQSVTVNSVPTADLAVTDARVLDGTVYSGQPARIAYTVTNVSEQPITASTWTDKVFLSANNVFEASDVEVGTSTKHNMSLAAGASYTDTATFRVPLPQNGTVYLIVRTNNAASFYESNTDNNTSSVECSVTLPQPGDLVVDNILVGGDVQSGDTLSVSWRVKNIGSNTLSGNGLRSLVYLSANTVFDADDRLLGGVSNDNVNIIPGGDVEQQLASRIAGLPEGDYYVIVKTDVGNMFNEVDDNNNTACSTYPFTLTIRQLPFNTPLADVLYNNVVNDYKLVVDTNVDQTVRVYLRSDDTASGAANMLYASHNNISNASNYDIASDGQYVHNPELYIPATEAGYYGINLQGSTPTAANQNVTIQADILPFELRDVAPNQGGNTGRVTVMLTGSRFSADMQVTLSNAQGTTIQPESLKYDSYYKAFATFDLTGESVGLYDVSVVKPGAETSTLHDAFRIVDGTPENLYTNIIFPQSPRPNRTVVAMLEYGNAGNTDIVNPVVVVNSVASTPVALTPGDLTLGETSVRVPLQVDGEPAGVLRPGTTGYVNVYISTVDNLTFTVSREEPQPTVHYPVSTTYTYSEIVAVAESAEGCLVGNDGVVSVHLSEGVDSNDYLYRWTTVDGLLVGTTRTVTGLAAGGYRVRMLSVADTHRVAYEDYVVVDKIDTCNSLRVHIGSVCYSGVCVIPSVESYATALGGTPPYSYSWTHRRHTVTGSGRYVLSCRVVDAAGRVAYGKQELYLKGMECSQDPNEIKGPEGYDEQLRFVAASEKMNYTIGFENDPDFATAPATRVSITYPVPQGQNIVSFRLSDFGFGEHVFSVPAGATTYSKRLDMSASLGVWVDVTAGIDMVNNQLFWIFQSIDPATGFEPASSQMGFLPVNDSLGSGEGYVSFLISPSAGRHTGDTVAVDATIVFDDNAPIATNRWKNTFDAEAPSSTLQAVTSDSGMCLFSFAAADEQGGSGVDHVELYVSQNEGSYEYYASAPADSTLRFPLVDGILYRFASVAVDHVGNREPLKSSPDTVINNNTAPTDILLTASSFRENASVSTVIGRLTTIDNDITLPFSYELVDGDGDADNALFSIVDGRLVTGGRYNCDGRSRYSVRVRTTDITGLSFEKSFALNKIQENFAASTSLSEAICEGDSYTFGSRVLTTQDTYVDSLHTVMGCDSIVTLTLQVNPVYHHVDTQVACDNFTWQDSVTYVASTTTPMRTLTTVQGCDSTVTLHLTVNRSNAAIETQTACDSYQWHGTLYTASTDAPTYVTTNAAGCDSTVTLHLTVNHSTTADTMATACDAFTWHGTVYTASTDAPTYVTTNVAGCDSTVTLHLTVNHSNAAIETQTACDSYEWHGTVYTASTDAPTYVTTNVAGCDSTVTLHLTVNHSNAAIETQTACDSYEWHGTVYTASTDTPTYVTTNAAGCDSTTTLHLTVNHSTTADTVATACDSYEWHGTVYTASTDAPTYVTTNAAGCDSTVTLHLTVNHSTTGDTVATACDSYEWHGIVYTASTDTATYVTTNAAGCDSIVTLHLTVNHGNAAIETQTACDSYEWHGTVYTASTDAPTYVITNAAGCDSTTTLHLTVNYSNTAIETQTACDSYEWHGTVYTASTDEATYVTTNVAGCDSTTTLHLTVNNSTTGDTIATACDSYEWYGTAYTDSTDTATYVTTNAVGCDSTTTLHLTVNHSTVSDTMATACDSYEWHGTVYTSSTDAPTYVTTNAVGCDSTTTLHLTVNHSNAAIETQTACDSYEWHGTVYTASTDAPTYVTTNAAGCDSTVTLHLTVNYSNAAIETQTACDSYEWHGTVYTASTDTATYVTTNAAGCDSTTTLHLTVNYSNAAIETQTACDSYEWHGTRYTATTDTATFVTTNAAGCDSTITLHLTVNHSTTADTMAVACDSYEWHGTVYTASTDEATFVTTNAAGCDSTTTLHLTVNYSAEVTIVDSAQNSYVWNGDTLTESGTYTYSTTTFEGCDSTVTLVLTIEAVGIDDVATVNVYLYPNPTRDYVTIVADEVISVEVFDVVGRKVATYANTNRIDLSALEFGNYTLRIRHAHGTSLRRVVKTN